MNRHDPAFNFEHRRAHVSMALAGAQRTSSSNFFGLPYWIDPAYGDTAVPAGWENTLHAQAHADFLSLFPPAGGTNFGGSNIASLNDIALQPEPLEWWQFSNFQLHYVAQTP